MAQPRRAGLGRSTSVHRRGPPADSQSVRASGSRRTWLGLRPPCRQQSARLSCVESQPWTRPPHRQTQRRRPSDSRAASERTGGKDMPSTARTITESLWHAPGTDQPDHACARRLLAYCADCGREVVMCTADRETVVRVVDQVWLCDDCAAEDRPLTAAAVAGLVLVVVCVAMAT